MANYYTDHPEIEFHLNHPLMKRVVDLKERNYVEKDQFEDAPVNYEDAIENYKRLLDITGDVAANIIEPNSEDVDLEGPHLENGRMIYASKTFENLDATRKAGLWGLSMPRRYGGLNLPNAIFSMASEIIAAADAGFQNHQITVLFQKPEPVSRTSGRSRAVSIHSMSSVLRSSARSTFLASAQARP